jgi:hypothetical protein
MTKIRRSLQIAGIIGIVMASINVNAQNKLVAYWSFDSVNKNTYFDMTGHGYDAVKTGDSVRIVDGLVGKALECSKPALESELILNLFDIQIKNSLGAFDLHRFTIEGWLYAYVDINNIDSSFYSTHDFFKYQTVGMEGSGLAKGYGIFLDNTGKMCFCMADNSGGWYAIYSDSTIKPHRWYYVAATYDSSTMKLYFNGRLTSSMAANPGVIAATQPARIACQFQTTSGTDGRTRTFFNGKIDELKFYNYALDSQTIAANYNELKPPDQQPFKITLGMSPTYCKPGDTIIVPVLLTNFENFSMSALQFNFKIDPAKLKLLDVSKDSGLVKDWMMSWNNNLTDSIPVALAGLTKNLGYGQGELLRCKYLVNKSMSTNDSTFIALNNVMVDEDTTHLITVTLLPGKVATLSPSIFYGDVNGNKKVDAGDAQEILAAVVGSITVPDPVKYPSFTNVVADVSGDGTISSFDAALVLQYCTGMISKFPVEQKKSLAKKAMLYSLAIPPSVADLSLNYVSNGPGGMLFQITGNNLAGFVSGDFAVGYDPAITGVLKSDITTTRRTATLHANIDQTNDIIKIGMLVNDPVCSNDSVIVLATITLPPNATLSPSTAFQLKKAQINEGGIPATIAGMLTGAGNSVIKKSVSEQTIRYFNRQLLIHSNSQPVLVRIYTLQGTLVQKQLFSKSAASTITVPTGNFPAGVYIYKIVIGNEAARAGNMVVDR